MSLDGSRFGDTVVVTPSDSTAADVAAVATVVSDEELEHEDRAIPPRRKTARTEMERRRRFMHNTVTSIGKGSVRLKIVLTGRHTAPSRYAQDDANHRRGLTRPYATLPYRITIFEVRG